MAMRIIGAQRDAKSFFMLQLVVQPGGLAKED